MLVKAVQSKVHANCLILNWHPPLVNFAAGRRQQRWPLLKVQWSHRVEGLLCWTANEFCSCLANWHGPIAGTNHDEGFVIGRATAEANQFCQTGQAAIKPTEKRINFLIWIYWLTLAPLCGTCWWILDGNCCWRRHNNMGSGKLSTLPSNDWNN